MILKSIYIALFLGNILFCFNINAQCDPNINFSGEYEFGKFVFNNGENKYEYSSGRNIITIEQKACQELTFSNTKYDYAEGSLFGNPSFKFQSNGSDTNGLLDKSFTNVEYFYGSTNNNIYGEAIKEGYWNDKNELIAIQIIISYDQKEAEGANHHTDHYHDGIADINHTHPVLSKNILDKFINSRDKGTYVDFNEALPGLELKNDLEEFLKQYNQVSLLQFIVYRLSKDPLDLYYSDKALTNIEDGQVNNSLLLLKDAHEVLMEEFVYTPDSIREFRNDPNLNYPLRINSKWSLRKKTN